MEEGVGTDELDDELENEIDTDSEPHPRQPFSGLPQFFSELPNLLNLSQ